MHQGEKVFIFTINRRTRRCERDRRARSEYGSKLVGGATVVSRAAHRFASEAQECCCLRQMAP